MNILDLLNNEERLLSVADFESKKIKTDVEQVYNNFLEMNSAIKTFNDFANSQLNGEYHNKIVMVKSLKEYFNNWQGVVEAYNKFEKEEKSMLDNYYNVKNKLITSLTTLQKETLKEPVLSLYDLYEGELVKCNEGHEIVLLGSQNARVLEYVINELTEKLQVAGNFDSVTAKGLSSNYSNVERNVEECNSAVENLFESKPNKQEKFRKMISCMEEVGKKIVEFMTFKQDLLTVGCNEKAMNEYEKAFTKQYIPLKKTLQKSLKLQLVDICDVVVDENNYQELDEENLPNEFESVADVTNQLNEEYVNYINDESVVSTNENEEAGTSLVEENLSKEETEDNAQTEELDFYAKAEEFKNEESDENLTEEDNSEEETRVNADNLEHKPNFNSILSSLQSKVKDFNDKSKN